MAQFRATIKGRRGEASRLGDKSTGMFVSVNGWDSGVSVEVFHRGGVDVFEVYATGGSHAKQANRLIGTVHLNINGKLIVDGVS